MDNRFKQVELATWVGIVGNLFLTLLKGVVGFFSGSKALIADAAHSASDVLGSVVVLFGVREAKKPPDEEHPYGHGKAENVAAIVVALLLVFVGIEIAISSGKAFFDKTTSAPSVAAIIVLIIAIVAKEAMFHYKYRLSKKLNSPALMAEAWHHRSDVYTSVIALMGIAGSILGDYWQISWLVYLDPLAGVIVAGFIGKMGYDLAKESAAAVLEQVLDKEETQPFVQTAASIGEVLQVDQVLARTHGHYVVIDIKVSVDASLSVAEGHSISKQVKEQLLQKHEQVRKVLVHINPYHY